MSSRDQWRGMLEAALSVLDEAPGIPGYKQITPEMAKEASRRARAWLAAHPERAADSDAAQGHSGPLGPLDPDTLSPDTRQAIERATRIDE